MSDLGVQKTEKRIAEIHQQLERIYREAENDLRQKSREYIKAYIQKDRQKRAERDSGKITEQEYKDWQAGQVFIGKQWRSKVKQMTRSLINAERTAIQIVRDGQMDTFADNANFMSYSIDRGINFSGNFSLYDADAVMNLVRDEPELLRRRDVDAEKSEGWNQKIIANCITQGIIQGESVTEVAKRIARDTASTDMKAMVRYARTAMTGAQNAGRILSMERSVEQGIEVRKVWIATLDDRTRDAHADLDGQVQDVKEPFDSELGPIMYPGDPSADDANIWNCRCTLGYEFPDSPSKGERYDQEYDEVIDDMTYDEWVEWRNGMR